MTLAHLALVFLRHGPILVADEIGYLTNARALAGGTGGQMAGAGFTHAGYPLLLAPFVGVGSPLFAYRVVLVVNTLLAVALVPLLYVLLRRAFGAAAATAAPLAVAAAVYPSVTILSQVAMSENLLFVGYVAWLVAVVEVSVGGPRAIAWAGALAVVSSLLVATHGRMLVVFALSVLAVIVARLRDRIGRSAAAVGFVGLAVGWVCARLLDDVVVRRSYGGEKPSEVAGRLSALWHPHNLAVDARTLVGQSWYLLVATLGLPLAALLAARSDRVPLTTRARTAVALLGLSSAGLLLLSAIAFPNPYRPDQWIYGRYDEVVAPAVIAVAGFVVVRSARRLSLAAAGGGVLAATALVAVLRPTVHTHGGGNRWDVAALPGPPLTLGVAALVLSGIAAAVWGAAAVAAARRHAAYLALVLLAAFAFPTANTERNPVLSGDRQVYGAGWTSPADAVDHSRPIVYDTRQSDLISRYAYQWWFRSSRFGLSSGWPRSGFRGYVIAPRGRAPAGARIVWRDPNRPEGVYSTAP
jgi:hypothetical protein